MIVQQRVVGGGVEGDLALVHPVGVAVVTVVLEDGLDVFFKGRGGLAFGSTRGQRDQQARGQREQNQRGPTDVG